MNIKFIGTGSGKVQIERFHTSTLISCNNHNLLIDTGDGVSKALLKLEINLTEIDSIIITHTHADHFAGLPSLLTQMKMLKRENELNLFVHSSSLPFFIQFLENSLIFLETLPFKLSLKEFNFIDEIKFCENCSLIAKRNTHLDKLKRLNINQELEFVSSSFLITCNNVALHYTSDIGSYSDLELFKNYSPDYLISEATHISLNEIARFLQTSKIKKAFLNHINDEDFIIEKFSQLPKEERRNMALTFDGMDINLS